MVINLDVVENGGVKDPTKVLESLPGIGTIQAPMVFVSHNGRLKDEIERLKKESAEKGLDMSDDVATKTDHENLSLAPVVKTIKDQWTGRNVIMAKGLTGEGKET